MCRRCRLKLYESRRARRTSRGWPSQPSFASPQASSGPKRLALLWQLVSLKYTF